ncbi:replication-associated protein [Sichuan tick-associated circovirus 1]|nr:replication-associated protein [Sichuan tick-associated circovirus 1]
MTALSGPVDHSLERLRYRHVCFTSFEVDAPAWDPAIMSYLIYGREICPDTARQHWQCYCEFKTQQRFNRIRQLFPGSHIERRHGSADQAASYCKKDNSFTECGTISKQGKRSDLLDVCESIVSGECSIDEVALSQPALFVQYGRGIERLGSLVTKNSQPKWRNVICEIWWGATGTGKTRKWFTDYEDGYRYQYSKNNNWFDGYYAQKHILFDEFNCQILMSDMLMYLDGHPVRMEVKGAVAYAHWTSVVLISNDDPQGWYMNCSSEKRKAFARRIHKVIHFTGSEIVEHDGFIFRDIASTFVSADAAV